MNDDIIQKAAEAMWDAIDNKGILGRLCREDCDYLAQALADAGLLPTEAEWGVQNQDVPVEKEHVFRTRDAAEVAQIITRANFPWPGEITLVTRYVTPWKDAS